jgi:hypothetical protein
LFNEIETAGAKSIRITIKHKALVRKLTCNYKTSKVPKSFEIIRAPVPMEIKAPSSYCLCINEFVKTDNEKQESELYSIHPRNFNEYDRFRFNSFLRR